MMKRKSIIKLFLAFFVFSIALVFTSAPRYASAAPTESECQALRGVWVDSGTFAGQQPSGTGICSCNPSEDNNFLGFPKWYKYLSQQPAEDPVSGAVICNVKLSGIRDVWLVVAAAIEILLRVSALIAIGFIIYGGVSYVISQGSPDKTKKAQATIINALIGLVISIIATASVSFFAGRF